MLISCEDSYQYMIDALYRERHFLIFIFILFVFSVGVSFCLAPFIASQTYTYLTVVLLILAGGYGHFTARFVHSLDRITHNHHAGVWITAITGCLLGFWLLQYQLRNTVYGSLLPGSDTLYLLGLAFATVYSLSFTGTEFALEVDDPIT